MCDLGIRLLPTRDVKRLTAKGPEPSRERFQELHCIYTCIYFMLNSGEN